jgi:signal transduction histidine kinase
LLTIADDGPGIAPSERRNVFRRFYRLDASRGSPGNGLGLSLVAAIAELHGIDIRLADNVPQGLKVALNFPPTTPGPVSDYITHQRGGLLEQADPGYEPHN